MIPPGLSSFAKRHLCLLLAGLAFALALASPRLAFTDGDEGRYTLLGLALAEGQGRTDIHLPEPKPDFLTPPLFPWVVGAMIRAFGVSPLPLKASSLIFFAMAVGLLAGWARRRSGLSPSLLAMGVVLGCGNVFVLSMNWWILAEMFFLFLLVAAWSATDRESVSSRHALLWALLAGLLAGATVLVRPSGLALLPAGALHFATRRRWGPLLAFLVAGLLVNLPTMLHTQALVGTPIAYLTHYRPGAGSGELAAGSSALLETVRNVLVMAPRYHFHYVPQHLFFQLLDGGGLLHRIGLAAITPPLSFLIGLLVLAGMASRGRRFGVAEWFYLGYLALISTYNQPDWAARGEYFYQDRYLHSLLPLAGLYVLLALRWISARFRSPWAARLGILVPAAATAYVLLTSLAVCAIRLRAEGNVWGLSPFAPERHLAIDLPEHQAFGRFLELILWAGEHTEGNALLVSRMPRHAFLVGGRQGFRPTELNGKAGDTWGTWTGWAARRPLYIVQDGYGEETGYGLDGRRTVDPLLAAHPERFRLVHETAAPVTRLWRLLPE